MQAESLIVLYGHTLAAGSAERQVILEAASLRAATLWISLDPLGGDSEPPQGVFWLRLGEPGLAGNSWRQILAQAAKLVPALAALGATAIQPLGDAARAPARLLALLLGSSWPRDARTVLPRWRAALPEMALHLFSPARAKRMATERQDIGQQLATLIDTDYYRGQGCPMAEGIDPVEHYLAAGQYAGLPPHPLFWTRWYARQLPHASAATTPWRHFVENGRLGTTDPNPFFQTRWYNQQPGAGRHHDNPLLDLKAHGEYGTHGPDPNPLFEQAWYQSAYDCGRHLPLEHFVLTGARLPSGPFLARHPELAPPAAAPDGYTGSFMTAFASGPSHTPAPRPVVDARHDGGTRVGRIAVCCVLTGGYDSLQPILHRQPDTDYFLLTDAPSLPPATGWRHVRVPSDGRSPLLHSRLLKMNLLTHLPGADQYAAVVYVDGNVGLVGSLVPLVQGFLDSGADLAVVPHPFRRSVYEEAAAVMLQLRERRENVMRVIELLEAAAFPPGQGLYEMNLFCFRPSPAAAAFFSRWWDLYWNYGGRDQLLAPLVAWEQNLSLYPLLPAGESVRTHPAFRYCPHRP